VRKSSDLIRRLEALNGRSLQETPETREDSDLEAIRKRLRFPVTAPSGPAPIMYRRGIPASPAVPKKPKEEPSEPFVALADVARGEEQTCPNYGKALHIQVGASEIYPADALNRDFPDSLQQASTHVYRRMESLCGSPPFSPEEILFLDLETAGLGNTPIFLVGMMEWQEDSFVLRQFLARDYSEEAAITLLFGEVVKTKRLLVSFNGKSFDVPCLRTRAAANGVRLSVDLPHLDLLHESRRAWGKYLRDCRLQTLEFAICHRKRMGDIPGGEVPDAYHAFVRTGNATRMARILMHNRLDLLTLAELLVKLPSIAAP
jgi:uncharacterized protein YprB with RNaseH-like and TPR domain